MSHTQRNSFHEMTTQPRPVVNEQDRALLRRFVRGEITFAELEGMTAEDALALAETGHGFFKSGRIEEARTIFEGLAAVNHLDPYPRQVLGAICEREQETEQALRHYDVCLSLHRDNPWVLARRGEIRVRSGELHAGVEDLARACELDPKVSLMTTARAQLILSSLVDAAADGADESSGA